MVPKDKLAVSPVTRPEDSCFKSSEKASSVVERSKKSKNGLCFSSTGFASNQGWGAHLQNMTVSGNWTHQEKLLHINVLQLKAVFLALKSF